MTDIATARVQRRVRRIPNSRWTADLCAARCRPGVQQDVVSDGGSVVEELLGRSTGD